MVRVVQSLYGSTVSSLTFMEGSFRTLDSIIQALTCPYCEEHLDNPVTFPCGCTLCSVCAVDSVNDYNGCSACKRPFHSRDVSEDYALRNLVSLSEELKVVLLKIGELKKRQLERTAAAAGAAPAGAPAAPVAAAAAEGGRGGERSSKGSRGSQPVVEEEEKRGRGSRGSRGSQPVMEVEEKRGRGSKGSRSSQPVVEEEKERSNVSSSSSSSRRSGGAAAAPQPLAPPPSAHREATGALRAARGAPLVLCGTGLNEESRRLLRRARAVLGGATSVVEDFDAASVTHVVTQCAGGEGGRVCKRTLKFALGVLTGCWIVSTEWLSAVLRTGGRVEEGPYEVQGITQSPQCRAPELGRGAVSTGVAPLFSGLTFRLLDPLAKSLSREDAMALVRAGGGVLAAEGSPLAPLSSAQAREKTLAIVSLAQEDWLPCTSSSSSSSSSAAGLGGKGRVDGIASLKASALELGLVVVDQLWLLDSITSLTRMSVAHYGFDRLGGR